MSEFWTEAEAVDFIKRELLSNDRMFLVKDRHADAYAVYNDFNDVVKMFYDYWEDVALGSLYDDTEAYLYEIVSFYSVIQFSKDHAGVPRYVDGNQNFGVEYMSETDIRKSDTTEFARDYLNDAQLGISFVKEKLDVVCYEEPEQVVIRVWHTD